MAGANGLRATLERVSRTVALRRGGSEPTCSQCRFFTDDPHELERMLPMVLVLSSTYGSARGDSGVCRVRETFQQPEQRCRSFAARR